MISLQISNWKKLNRTEQKSLLARPKFERSLEKKVKNIIEDVRFGGDEKLRQWAQKYDNLAPNKTIKVNKNDQKKAWQDLPSALKVAMKMAHKNITHFHKMQKPKKLKVSIEPGLVCEQIPIPIESVGLYVPGGTAPLFSTLLMLAIPARLAGCKNIAVTSPGRSQVTLAAAHLCKIDNFYAIGGAQAIAALAYGTPSIPPVSKIFGPGNSWVTEAKTQVSTNVAIDMPAGPSEVLVIADQSSNPEFVMWDLLSQAEHGPDSQVVLLCSSKKLIQQVIKKIQLTLPTLKRKKIIKQALANSCFILTNSNQQSINISNNYAPEHLILQCLHSSKLKAKIKNAGSVFVGCFSPESCGDYASGTNHVLPTGGAAKAYSGVSMLSFYKWVTFQQLSQKAINNLAPSLEVLAQAENLYCHSMAATVRRTNI